MRQAVGFRAAPAVGPALVDRWTSGVCNGRNDLGACRAEQLAQSGLLLRRSEVLRSLRRCRLLAQSRGHHTIDRQEERSVERGCPRRSSLRGREKTIVNQTGEKKKSPPISKCLWFYYEVRAQLLSNLVLGQAVSFKKDYKTPGPICMKSK